MPNRGFLITGVASHAAFSTIACDLPPDKHLLDTGQFFPRWSYEKTEGDDTLFAATGDGEIAGGYRRLDNITDSALARFRAAYGDAFSKDDIFHYVYGLLHSPDYRRTYAADLKKMLPRIPLVIDAVPYVEAGRRLAEMHLGYESIAPYPLAGLDIQPPPGVDPLDFYRVQKMRLHKDDRTTITYNERITLSGIPDEAYRYQLGARSAIEWIIDRYQLKVDKPSGIKNDPNDWSREVGDPRYILDLLARIVTVSLETMKIVDNLPPLEVRADAR
jgi:predicted helicase